MAQNDETLFGIDKIRPHVGNVSVVTLLKYKREYPSFPMRKMSGIWVANKEAIVEWFRKFCIGEVESNDKDDKKPKKTSGNRRTAGRKTN